MIKKITVRSGEGISPLTEFDGTYSDNTYYNQLKKACDRLGLPMPESHEGNFTIGDETGTRWINIIDQSEQKPKEKGLPTVDKVTTRKKAAKKK